MGGTKAEDKVKKMEKQSEELLGQIKRERPDMLDTFQGSFGYDNDKKYSDMQYVIKDLRHQSKNRSQEAVNQFGSEIQRTQQDLQERFPEGEIVLYRGLKRSGFIDNILEHLRGAGEVNFDDYFTSWSSDENVAKSFSGEKGVIIKKTVPVSDILFSYHTSPYIRTSDFMFGGNEEFEYIVGHSEGYMSINEDEIIYA